MARLETAIYTARNARQARRLREALEAAGIEARVAEPGGPAEPGTGAASRWAGIRVLVAEGDALAARQVAAEFAEHGPAPAVGGFAPSPAGAGAPAAEPDASTLPDWWPICPGCGAARSTACPICGTAGTRFEPIDMGFSLIEGLDDVMGASGPSCGSGGCGPDGCTPLSPPDSPAAGSSLAELPASDRTTPEQSAAAGSAESPGADRPPADVEDGPDMADHMVICPTCDEPFGPVYPKRCEWCGHEFPDGVDMPLPDGDDDEPDFTGRVYAVIGLLLAIALAGLLYFRFMLY